MITGELRSKIDKIWETFWTGGITNPLEVIEQFTYLLFIKGLDDKEIIKENDALLLGIDFDRTFPEDKQNLRWSKFKNFEAETMYDVVSNEVFTFIKNLHTNKDSAYAKYMGDAIFKIRKRWLTNPTNAKMENTKNRTVKTKSLFRFILIKRTNHCVAIMLKYITHGL